MISDAVESTPTPVEVIVVSIVQLILLYLPSTFLRPGWGEVIYNPPKKVLPGNGSPKARNIKLVMHHPRMLLYLCSNIGEDQT